MTVTEEKRTAPPLRLRRAHRGDPPFDDEREPERWWSPHQLALDWSRPTVEVPPLGRDAPHASSAPTHRTVVSGASADAKLAVRTFVSSCVEVLNGYRPAAHLRRLAQPREAAAVVAQGVAAARKVAQTRLRAPGLFHPPGNARPRRPAPVAVVRSTLCEPRPGAVEAAVVLMIGDRTLAMAFRLEQHNEAWLATVLRLI
ncbi:Rv3235 family protein [Actinoplanes sp. NPDC051346]|uniref:Rv3235 family protein n=1 Tax=Actinoplanes sp. NPDC051346 TaxID=3155048 RepID=UPI00343E522A